MRTLIVAALAGLSLFGCGAEPVELTRYPSLQIKLEGTPKPETPIPAGQRKFGSILSTLTPTASPTEQVDGPQSLTFTTSEYQTIKVTLMDWFIRPDAVRVLENENAAIEQPPEGSLKFLALMKVEYMAGSRPLTVKAEDISILDLSGETLDLLPCFHIRPEISLFGQTAASPGSDPLYGKDPHPPKG